MSSAAQRGYIGNRTRWGIRKFAGIGGWLSPVPIDTSWPSTFELFWFEAHFENGRSFGLFNSKQPRHMVTVLEALGILMALKLFLSKWPHLAHHFSLPCGSDSMVSVWATGSWKTRSPGLKLILRGIAFVFLKCDLCLFTHRVEGEENVMAGALSRSFRHPGKRFIFEFLSPEIRLHIDISEDPFSHVQLQWLDHRIGSATV